MKKLIYLPIFILVTFGNLFLTSQAANAANESSDVGFNIQMVPNDSQINQDVSYFDLRLAANETKEIEFTLSNTSNSEGTYKISVNQAYTNKQGFIDYSDVNGGDKSLLPYKVNDIITYDKKVTVPANTSVTVPLTITMPEKNFDGQILAGIQVLKDKDKSSGQINVDYGYILGLKITETDNTVKREINLLNVQAEASFGEPSVVAKLENPTMDAIGHLKYDVSVINRDNKKEIFSTVYDNNMELAPNSIYNLAITFGEKRLVSGKYTLNLTVTDAKENKWVFKKNFEVSRTEANTINNATIDAGKAKFQTVWIVLIVILVLILLGILIFYILYRKKKKEQQEEKKE